MADRQRQIDQRVRMLREEGLTDEEAEAAAPGLTPVRARPAARLAGALLILAAVAVAVAAVVVYLALLVRLFNLIA